MTEQLITIYALTDPRSGAPRYVGKTTDMERRYRVHITNARLGKTQWHKDRWIRSLLAMDLQPGVTVLEAVTASEWKERERYWIARLQAERHNLTNATVGGDGVDTPRRPEWVEKIRQAQKGKIISPEQREQIRQTLLARCTSCGKCGQRWLPELTRIIHRANGTLYRYCVPCGRANALQRYYRRIARENATRVPVPAPPPRCCAHCGRQVRITAYGRCGACTEYQRRHQGTPRPLVKQAGLQAGERNPSAHLTWQEVDEIRQRWAAGGVQQTELAREYGVWQATISSIVLGKTWKPAQEQ